MTAKRKTTAKTRATKAHSTRKVAKRRVIQRGYHIDPERPRSHGVTRPSKSTWAGSLWRAFDKVGIDKMDIERARSICEKLGRNVNHTTIQFYRWRQFHGIRGRQ